MDNDSHSGTQRLETFSDGVMAIAITLLIIQISVPLVTGDASLGKQIGDLWPSYFAYILSFATIGIYWANHHSFLKLFRRTDHTFLMLNVLFLMTIAFLPFPTAVLGEYLKEEAQRADAVTFYSFGPAAAVHYLVPAVALRPLAGALGRGVGAEIRWLGYDRHSYVGYGLRVGCLYLSRDVSRITPLSMGCPGNLR